jgi:hypothetical protein
MLKVFNNLYYIDLEEINNKSVILESVSGVTEQQISVVNYELIKIMIETILTEKDEVDETLGMKSSSSLSIPFKIAFNSLMNKKLLNKY